jgi:hypothetical protein
MSSRSVDLDELERGCVTVRTVSEVPRQKVQTSTPFTLEFHLHKDYNGNVLMK